MQILVMMGEMLQRITRLRVEGHFEEALSAVILAQEKLFARPSSEFAALPIADQLHLLSVDESVANSRAKRLAYASTLKEAGLVYKARSKDTLAASAFQLALYVMLTVSVEPHAPVDDLRPQMVELMGFLSADELYPPITDLLKRMNGRTQS